MYEIKVISSITGEVVHLEIVESREDVYELNLEWGELYELVYYPIDEAAWEEQARVERKSGLS